MSEQQKKNPIYQFNSTFIHFLGAAGTVTGSKYFIETPKLKFMVDCGLFQGLKELRLLNWNYLPVDASEIDTVLITHGHLDHVGFLPRLVNMGFKGKIYGTQPTLDVAAIILRDSAKIQEEEAERANREGYSKHTPAKPLYDLEDVEQCLEHFSPIEEGEWIQISEQIQARWQYVGHIIGATFIEVEMDGKRLVFSGDVGRTSDLLMHAPKKPKEADVLFIESTYGGRVHPNDDPFDRLAEIINNTLAKGGHVIIPSFAVERSQTLMYILWKLVENRAIPHVPMIMDSPMGANVLDVFRRNLSWHKLTAQQCVEMCSKFHIVKDFAETQLMLDDPQPKIVIAGSGMMNGGRVLSYLQRFLSKPETTVVVMGFQAVGTRGRALIEGAEELKIYGKMYEVNAHVEIINSLSAHGDENELIDWLSELKKEPTKTFIIHGETKAAEALQQRILKDKGWQSEIPTLFSIVAIDL